MKSKTPDQTDRALVYCKHRLSHPGGGISIIICGSADEHDVNISDFYYCCMINPDTMRKFPAPLLFILFAVTAAFSTADRSVTATGEVPVSLGEFLYTVTLNKDMPIEDAQYHWFHEYLEPGVNDSVFEPMLDLIKRSLITVYEPSYPFQKIMKKQDAVDLFISKDSIMTEDPYNPDIVVFDVVQSEHHANEIVSVTFHEQWEYDPVRFTLNKTVLGIIPNMKRYDNMGLSYVKATCYIPVNNQPSVFPCVNVNGITSDFVADGSEHSDRYNDDSIATDPTITGYQAKITTRILGDIQSRTNDKGFVLFEPEFPFTQKVDKKIKADKLAKLSKSNMLTFYEDWEINPRQRVFRKKVKGVMPQSENVIKSDNGNFKWFYENSVLVPFNSFIPQQMNSEVCVIDRMSFDVLYKNVDYQLCPKEISPEDSAFIDTVALDIREHVKGMELKSFGPTYPGAWCDPFSQAYVELNKQQVRDLFYRTDTVQVENREDGTFNLKAVEFEYGHDYDCGLRFFENWTFNFKKQSFSKQTLYVGMDRYVAEDDLWHRSFRFTCFYQCQLTDPADIKTAKPLYRSTVYSGCLLNYNEFNYNENDNGDKVVSYYDNWHGNIDPSKRYSLIQPVIEQVRAGSMTAIKPGQGANAFTVTEFNQMMKDVAAKAGVTYRSGMEFALFNEIFFEEQWYYNRVNGQFYKEVTAITFGRCDRDTGDPDYMSQITQPYFTIRLKPVQ